MSLCSEARGSLLLDCFPRLAGLSPPSHTHTHYHSFLNASTLLLSPGATRLVASRCGGAVAAYAPRGRAAVSPLTRGPTLAPPLPVGDGPLGYIEAAVFEVDAKAHKGSPAWRFAAVTRPPPRGRDAPPGAPRLLLHTITAAGRTVVSPLELDRRAGRLKLLLAERGSEWVVALLEHGHVGFGATASSALDMAATTWFYERDDGTDGDGDDCSDGGDRSFDDGGDSMETDSGRAAGSGGGGGRRRSAVADAADDDFYTDPRPCSAAATLIPRSLVVKLEATTGDIVAEADVPEGPAVLFYTHNTGVRAHCPAAEAWPNVPDDLATQDGVAILAVMPGGSLLVTIDRKPPLRATFGPGTEMGDHGVALTPLDRADVGPIEHAASDPSFTSIAAATQRGAAVLTAGVPTRAVAAAAPGTAPGLAAVWSAAGPRGGGVVVASFADATRALAAAQPGAPLADVTTVLGLVADERSVAFGGFGSGVAAQVTPARVRLVSLDRLTQTRRGQPPRDDDADYEWLPPPGATIGAAAVAEGGVLVSTSDVRGVALLAVGMSEELQVAVRCATKAEVSCLALAPATAPRSTTLALAGTYEPGAVLFAVTPVPGGGITMAAVATLALPPPPRVWGRGAAAAPPPPPSGGHTPPFDVPDSVLLLPAPGGGAHALVGWRSGALTHAAAAPPPTAARRGSPWTLHPTAVARVGGLPLTLRPAPPGSGAAALAVGERAALVLPPGAPGRAATVVRLDVGAGARAAAPLPSADVGSMVVAYADGGLAVLAVEGGALSRLRVLPAGDDGDIDSEDDEDEDEDDEDEDHDAKPTRPRRKRAGHLGHTVCPLPASGAVAVACNWCSKFQTKGPTVEVVDVGSGAVLATTELPPGCRVTSIAAWPPGPPPPPGGGGAIRWDGGAGGPGLRVALEPAPAGVAPRGGAAAPPLPPPPPSPTDGRAERCVAVSTEALDEGAVSVFASGRYEAARRAGARRGKHGRVAVLALLRDARASAPADADPPPTWRLDIAADVLAPDPFTTLAILPDGGLAAGCGRRLAVLGHTPRLTTRATAAHARAASAGAIRLTRRGWVSVRHPPSWVGVATASDGRAVLAVADGEDGPLMCVRAGGAAAAGAAPPPRARPGAGDGTGWEDDAALPVASGLVPRRATAAVPVAWPPGGGSVPPAPAPPSARGGPPPPRVPWVGHAVWRCGRRPGGAGASVPRARAGAHDAACSSRRRGGGVSPPLLPRAAPPTLTPPPHRAGMQSPRRQGAWWGWRPCRPRCTRWRRRRPPPSRPAATPRWRRRHR